MPHFDLFEFYRFVLAVLVGTYTVLRFFMFIWRWSWDVEENTPASTVLRRYFIVLMLRMRFRRFAYEFVVIGGLATVLILLIRLH